MDILPETEISTKILFSDITAMLERIKNATGTKKKAEILKGYFESFATFRTNFIEKSTNNCNSSFYPVLRLILPKQDRERESYGIKTFTLGKMYVRILGVDSNSDVAKRLTAKCSHKEYPDVVYGVMQNRCSASGKLTVYDVNRHLDIIASCFKNNERKKIDEEMIRMVEGMTAIDQKWIIRIILKDMNLGIYPVQILSTYHPSARDFFDLYSNLTTVCSLVESGKIFELQCNVEPFQPFHPMLCLRGSIANLHQVMTRKEFYLETKMDGERFQMHIVDGKYKYFSRKSNENDTFGADASQGSLTPFVQPLFKIQIKNLISDGEMMVWNREHLMYHTKGEHFDVKSIRANDSTLRPCFCAYDILYLNDRCLIDKPYAERIRLLATIFNEKPGVLTLCKPIKIRDSDHIIECMNKAFDEKEEGVVIKEADSMYAPGKRNAGWIKIKPDYVDGLVSDFDMLVLGGYYSQSRKLIYKFLIGVQKKGHTKDEFIAVTNISSGLNLAQLIEINNKLQPYWKNCAHIKSGRSTITNNPPSMNFGSQIPDVWIEPKNSIIFEVKASELVRSSSFGSYYTLRFPRIEAVRTDKNWYDCCQSDEFETFCSSNDAVKKIVKRQITSTDINSIIPSKRRKPSTTKEMKKQFSASSTVGNINLLYDDIQKVDNICAGLNFCVMNTVQNTPTLEELHRMILRHGGTVVQNPTKNTFVCIAGTESLRVTSLKEKKSHNIATVDWLVRAVGANVPLKKLLNFHPNDMICSTDELEDIFKRKYDEYADSFTKSVTTDELRWILNAMDEKKLEKLTRSDTYEMEKELAGDQSKPSNIFRLSTALFYKSLIKNQSKMELAEQMFKFRGGMVLNSFDNDQLSHVFVDPETFDFDRFKIECSVQCLDSKIRFVSYQWIIQCFQRAKKFNSNSFVIKI